MTTLTRPTPETGRSENRSAAVPMSRLIRVELRKLVDTRAGFWLLASIGVIATIVAVAMLIGFRNNPKQLGFGEFSGMMNIPTGLILPVMAILLVTGEWSQRTALATFTMEPRRERIVAAKLIASLAAALAAVAVSLLLGAIATVIAGLVFPAPAGAWNLTAAGLVNSLVLQLFGLLLGFGFAALILNTPGAIVAYFVLPSALALVSGMVPWFERNLGTWIDTDSTNRPFQSTEWATGGQWWHLIVSAIVWIAIPLTFGVLRIMRSEVK